MLSPDSASLNHLHALAESVRRAVDGVAQMMGANEDTAGRLDTLLGEIEAEATTTHMALLTSLRSDFLTPLPREDLYLLSTWLNQTVENLCGVGYVLHAANQYRLPTEAMDLLEIFGVEADLAKDAISQLSDFDLLEQTWIQLERQARRAQRMTSTLSVINSGDMLQRQYHRQRAVVDALQRTNTTQRQLIVHLGRILVRES